MDLKPLHSNIGVVSVGSRQFNAYTIRCERYGLSMAFQRPPCPVRRADAHCENPQSSGEIVVRDNGKRNGAGLTMPPSKRQKYPPNARMCHGCNGKGQLPVTQVGHWEDGGAADTKTRRVWVKPRTELQICALCRGTGYLLNGDGIKSPVSQFVRENCKAKHCPFLISEEKK